MASKRFKHLSKESSAELGLDTTAEELRKKISERIAELEKNGKNPIIYKRILDISEARSYSLWKGIDSMTCNDKLSKDVIIYLYDFLTTGIDYRILAWTNNDRRSAKSQKNEIRQIGALAKKLYTKINCSKYGYVTDFLNEWAAKDVPVAFELDDLVSEGSRPELGNMAFRRQKEIIDRLLLPSALILGLKSLSISASKYSPDNQKIPKSQIGLGSQKKSKLSQFVLKVHVELVHLTGKPHFGINADLSSIVFLKEISKRQVQEIIKRARERGEISNHKSTKSPLT